MLIRDVELFPRDHRIYVPVGEEDILPAVVVEIQETGPETQILGVHSQTNLQARVVEAAVAVVLIESRDLVGKVRAHDIEPAIPVIVGNSDPHARHGSAVLVERASGGHSDLAERPVLVVSVEQARGGITSDVDVWPAIVVEVRGRCAHAVRTDWAPVRLGK